MFGTLYGRLWSILSGVWGLDYDVLRAYHTDMICLPLEDLCRLHQAHVKIVVDAVEDYAIDNRTFTLGIFNGRKYTYTWFGKTPVILIDNATQLSETPDILGE